MDPVTVSAAAGRTLTRRAQRRHERKLAEAAHHDYITVDAEIELLRGMGWGFSWGLIAGTLFGILLGRRR